MTNVTIEFYSNLCLLVGGTVILIAFVFALAARICDYLDEHYPFIEDDPSERSEQVPNTTEHHN